MTKNSIKKNKIKFVEEIVDGEGRIMHGLSYNELLISKGIKNEPIPKKMTEFNRKADELIKRLDEKLST